MSGESENLDEDWGKRMRRNDRNCKGMKVGKVGKDSKKNHHRPEQWRGGG